MIRVEPQLTREQLEQRILNEHRASATFFAPILRKVWGKPMINT